MGTNTPCPTSKIVTAPSISTTLLLPQITSIWYPLSHSPAQKSPWKKLEPHPIRPTSLLVTNIT
ncbi:wsv377 [White spot syndrome virus]|uniref:Wsv377 n=4 Tax=White spot syndrome virus TaxID=342409 RepID=Q8VAM4_WSSVS|nr:wsv377 [Shrimp white spot syndrome virus]AFX59754.1 wsv377 [White spot syndrome virus]AAL33379.1 wsv377 [Shrimp white spot syndrome virus]AAL89304.1 WSSV436 [Shrimp white spot syndrome virus]AWQ60502.1 wsv377 [Shrimp white spot syndrome virus]AWQ60947.1 wsv377 [Shrimp white spot syndrome virus]